MWYLEEGFVFFGIVVVEVEFFCFFKVYFGEVNVFFDFNEEVLGWGVVYYWEVEVVYFVKDFFYGFICVEEFVCE